MSPTSEMLIQNPETGGTVEPNEAVVVPLVPYNGELSIEAMLRMLLNREALMIDRVVAPTTHGAASGMAAQASGAFAKAISCSVP